MFLVGSFYQLTFVLNLLYHERGREVKKTETVSEKFFIFKQKVLKSLSLSVKLGA